MFYVWYYTDSMDSLEFFICEFASYTAIESDLEDIETYLMELMDYDVNEYGPPKHNRYRRKMDP